jgi:hypothetical protein
MKKVSWEESLRVAQPREINIWDGVYQPKPHPYADRIAENKKIPSLYTASKIETTIKAK